MLELDINKWMLELDDPRPMTYPYINRIKQYKSSSSSKSNLARYEIKFSNLIVSLIISLI